MKISVNMNNHPKLTFVDHVKKLYFNGKVKLKTLLSDVFTPKTDQEHYKNIRHQGDKFEHKYLKTRDVPNCISTENDVAGTKVKVVKYYQEDIEKMRSMTQEELKEYKKQLKKEGKFFFEE